MSNLYYPDQLTFNQQGRDKRPEVWVVLEPCRIGNEWFRDIYMQHWQETRQDVEQANNNMVGD